LYWIHSSIDWTLMLMQADNMSRDCRWPHEGKQLRLNFCRQRINVWFNTRETSSTIFISLLVGSTFLESKELE
jgi:hypothetical protein